MEQVLYRSSVDGKHYAIKVLFFWLKGVVSSYSFSTSVSSSFLVMCMLWLNKSVTLSDLFWLFGLRKLFGLVYFSIHIVIFVPHS